MVGFWKENVDADYGLRVRQLRSDCTWKLRGQMVGFSQPVDDFVKTDAIYVELCRGEYPYCARLRKCAHAIISKTIVYR